MPQDRENGLEALARTLLANHIRLSVGDALQEEAHTLLGSEPPRGSIGSVVVVVGAGASHDAAGLPLGEDAANRLRAARDVEPKDFNHELRRLKMQYRLNPSEFETQLLALSRFGESPLLDELQRVFKRRFYCTKTYEILAHLLKHRFIDAIINFNFDELLDQAIEDEVGRRNCWMITSDGDLPESYSDLRDRMWEDGLRLPLYIKPHGTASHRSTMRFTREAYFLLPDDIRNLLEDCLTRTPRVTIVTLGFGMNSVEFSDIIETAIGRKKEIEVVAIDTSGSVLKRVPPGVKGRLLSPSGGIGALLEQLWQTVKSIGGNTNLLRGIERHQLLATLFTEKPDLDSDEAHRSRGRYFRDRVVVELALVAAKAKGFVSIDQLEQSRVWTYLRHYVRAHGGRQESIYSIAAKIGLRQTGYSRDAMRLEVPGKGSPPPTGLVIPPDDWELARPELCRKLVGQLNDRRREIARTEAGRREIEAALQAMYAGMEIEVYSPTDSRCELIFTEPQEFRSLVDLKVYTNQLLDQEWDRLFCVAESGEWLLEDRVWRTICKNANRRLAVIVAFDAYKQELLRKCSEAGLQVRIVELPWWLHNQHMTIVLRDAVPPVPIQALYFERRQRSLSINPVGLDHRQPNDLDALLASFCAYWVKATRFSSGNGSSYVSPDDVRQARRELLSESAWPEVLSAPSL